MYTSTFYTEKVWNSNNFKFLVPCLPCSVHRCIKLHTRKFFQGHNARRRCPTINKTMSQNSFIDDTVISTQETAKVHELQRHRANVKRLWFEIQDIIGPANKWPHIIRRLFWSKVRHDMRPIVAAFVVINGLNPEVCTHILNLTVINIKNILM